MLCTSLVEKNCEHKQNSCLCKLRTVTEVFTLRVAFKLLKWSLFIFLFMYQFKNQWWSICLHHVSAESALSLHFLGVLSASYSGVDLAFWSLHNWFCECSAAWISSTCFHCALLLSRYVLSCQICLWWFLSMPSFSSDCCSTRTVICVRNAFHWRQELHGFPTWISLFGSQDPEKEQFMMPRILI